ncbi:MAG: hypothetical protein M0006_01330 [Magnetospirillum sp.]|nr:hypothetical protein [Magnetospirillum sp.]
MRNTYAARLAEIRSDRRPSSLKRRRGEDEFERQAMACAVKIVREMSQEKLNNPDPRRHRLDRQSGGTLAYKPTSRTKHLFRWWLS